MRSLLAILLFVSATFAQKPLEEMIGQMLIVGFHGTSKKDEWTKTISSQIANGEIGGVILYGYNIVDPMQLGNLTAHLHSSVKKTPIFIAVDQEGGKVARLTSKKDFGDYPSAKSVGKTSVAKAGAIYRDMACELKGYGFNLNFAPVVDLDLIESESIGKLERAFSSDPKVVVKYAKAFIDSHNSCGIKTSIKHFVGHGFAIDDTHKVGVNATATPEELEPFVDLIDSDYAQMVMVSHLIDKNIDELPISLSKTHIDTLRDMGFDGVVVSDDMQMGAITEHFSFEESVVLAISAGVDLIVFSNYFYQDPEIPTKFKDAVMKAIDDGAISQEQIETSYKRIVKLKSGR